MRGEPGGRGWLLRAILRFEASTLVRNTSNNAAIDGSDVTSIHIVGTDFGTGPDANPPADITGRCGTIVEAGPQATLDCQ